MQLLYLGIATSLALAYDMGAEKSLSRQTKALGTSVRLTKLGAPSGMGPAVFQMAALLSARSQSKEHREAEPSPQLASEVLRNKTSQC